MLGYNHVTCAACAGVATLPIAPVHTPVAQTAWILGWSGMGLAPDLDKVGAHASLMWGPVSEALAGGVGALAGGHRRGTHDLVLAPLGAAVLAWLAAQAEWSSMCLLALTIGLTIRGLVALQFTSIGEAGNFLISWLGAWWIVENGHAALFSALPLVAAGGVLVHLLGDAITEEGLPVPIAWIFGVRTRIGLPLFRVGGDIERALVGPVLTLLLVWLLYRNTGLNDPAQTFTALEHTLTPYVKRMLLFPGPPPESVLFQ